VVEVRYKEQVLVSLVLICLISLPGAVEVPLEQPHTSYTDENVTIFYYVTEIVRISKLNETENTTYNANYPTINSTIDLGEFKWKGINRLKYLNEIEFNDTIYFILTLRKSLNESELANLSEDYNVTFDLISYSTENGSGEFPYPPDDELIDRLEEIVAGLEETYNNNSNFTFEDKYIGVKAHGNISDIMNLLYDNNTFNIDPGSYDLIEDYPNATFRPINYLYYEYENYTTCNDTLRTASTDVDGDLFLSCEGDCNDTNSSIHPGATEIADGIDNDCDGLVDEGIQCSGSHPPLSGNWDIDQLTECISEYITLAVDSILRVFNSETLILEDTEVQTHEIVIENDGELVLSGNSTIHLS